MSAYDKIPEGGVFRAVLAADWLDANRNKVILMELNASGQAVVSTGTAGTNGLVVGVAVVHGIQMPALPGNAATYRSPKAGERIDIMKRGEIVEIGTDVASAAAGKIVTYLTTSGAISTTAASGTQVQIGHLVEATRLVVNVNA